MGNENGDDTNDDDDEDGDDEDDDDRDDEDPIGYLVKKNVLMMTIYCLKMKMMGTVHPARPTVKRNTSCLIYVSISC